MEDKVLLDLGAEKQMSILFYHSQGDGACLDAGCDPLEKYLNIFTYVPGRYTALTIAVHPTHICYTQFANYSFNLTYGL